MSEIVLDYDSVFFSYSAGKISEERALELIETISANVVPSDHCFSAKAIKLLFKGVLRDMEIKDVHDFLDELLDDLYGV